MLSLSARLLLGASVVLSCFLGLTGVAVERAYRASADTALQDRLQGQIYALLAAADLTPEGTLSLPNALPDSRLNRPGSGLYARITNAAGRSLWHSGSAVGVSLSWPGPVPPGQRRFARIASDRQDYGCLSFGVTYVSDEARANFTFSVAEELTAFMAEIRGFRAHLWGWLATAAVLLLLTQGALMRWSLAPLRRVERDLAAIEKGQRRQLTGQYPAELRGLTENLNALLKAEDARVERYQSTLGDLAHSLKTPLAVLHGALEESIRSDDLATAVREQTSRMRQIVDYQLQRAAASGRSPLAAPMRVADAAQRVAQSLAKVYADKGVECVLDIEAQALFYGTSGDLLEILGNLLDNAYKWCRRRVRFTGRRSEGAGGGRPGLRLRVEDDGPGIPVERRRVVLGRGARGDGQIPGHGIGLAVVCDIVSLHRGTLTIDHAELGGARVDVEIPAG